MAQIWNVSDYSNILPGYQAGLQEWGMRQANERAKLQEERIQRIEEMRQAAERAQEARMAEQYRSTLAQQRSAQALRERIQQDRIDRLMGLAYGRAGEPLPADTPAAYAGWIEGQAISKEKDAARKAALGEGLEVKTLTDSDGNIVGRAYGKTVLPGSGEQVVTGSITTSDLMGTTRTRTPTFFDKRTGKQLFVPPAGATGGAVGTNDIPVVGTWDPSTRRLRSSSATQPTQAPRTFQFGTNPEEMGYLDLITGQMRRPY